jgi:hypothetical protein
LILHYLAQFEEPLFRKVEEAPAFYSDHITRFCLTGRSDSPLFHGLELPYGTARSASESIAQGGLDPAPSANSTDDEEGIQKKDDNKPQMHSRIFWITRLVNALANETTLKLDDEIIHRHLVRTGDIAPEPQPPLPELREETTE